MSGIGSLRNTLGAGPPRADGHFDTKRLDWFDLRNMLLVAECIVRAALARTESRGAHQREDCPLTEPDFMFNQSISIQSGSLVLARPDSSKT
jgi:succinate dehydrogenase / fumarate reductase flavoprotein subunit/fumarate reductase (CoM/CoB) subunit A